jgi:VIT1/CCC1 family predicted Fe2+/Mn2+ transporter
LLHYILSTTVFWHRLTLSLDVRSSKPYLVYPQRGRSPSNADALAKEIRDLEYHMVDQKGSRARYRANLQGEIDSASLYRTLAKTEQNPDIAKVYDKLASIEEAHAEFWKSQLRESGAGIPDLQPGMRTRALRWLARRFGPQFVLPTVNTLEQLDSGQYDKQPEAISAGLPAMERSHARVIEAIAGNDPQALMGGTLARLEGRHRGMGGNALRAAVLGANDGLCSNLSLVMGVAGAAFSAQTILMTGLAGLLAGACSMALGEWLSVNTTRESYQRQIDVEAAELDAVPDEEKVELELIYQAKGLPKEQAMALAERLISNKATALDTLAREELGIDPGDLGGSPWTAAATSFFLFSFGAIFPVAPFFFVTGLHAVLASLALSGTVLFLIGAGTTLFTGRPLLFSGMRQLLIGFGAAAITFGVGHLLGVAIAG